ncbi:zf-HC2 domain-containing protein [Deinococcus alpinitundrae]|uniref:zf-HC2 domain-containing protein n=1 Tax=Deinococcus alpinitundrae TaxID=468913 RepID=UPI00137B4374|nr:zf-HC2 domain-containing protein [Deinococcus alpinitundrae]
MTDCQNCREELDAVLLGIADPDTEQGIKAHLAVCPDCTHRAIQTQRALDGLLHTPPAVPMPAGARERLLASARAQAPDPPAPDRTMPDESVPLTASAAPLPVSSQRLPITSAAPRTAARHSRRPGDWLTAGLGATALAAFVLWPAPHPNLAHADVVVAAGDVLVAARSETSKYPLVIRTAGGGLRGVALRQPLPAWYTEGVYAGGRAYLLDAANARLVVLNVARGEIERSYPVPGGAAGLAVKDGSVFVKSAASGELRIFNGEHSFVNKLAKATDLPQADYMDAVLPLPERILTTQHTTGQVFSLSPDGEKLLATYPVGGAPVGLAEWQDQVLVLDVQGRLLQLGPDGQITRTLKVAGHPDKLSVMENRAYLTDRGGMVSVVNLEAFRLTGERRFGKPMDIVALPDGHLALADAERGVVMLRADLSEL